MSPTTFLTFAVLLLLLAVTVIAAPLRSPTGGRNFGAQVNFACYLYPKYCEQLPCGQRPFDVTC